MVTGVALGSADFYAALAQDARVTFAPVSVTHDVMRLSAINSALEVDLYGQVNGEFLGDRAISGVGGLIDLLRGAAAAPEGLPIIALNATPGWGRITAGEAPGLHLGDSPLKARDPVREGGSVGR